MYNQNLGVFRTVLEGLRGDELNVVVTVGNQNDPAAFGPQPANVQIHRFVPQDLVLPECTLAVIHGGAGSTVGALAFGLPLVLVPQGADQFFNTERVVAAGAGIGLPPGQFSADSVRQAVRALLDDEAYRTAAREHRPRDRGDAGCRTRGRGAGTPRQQPWIARPAPRRLRGAMPDVLETGSVVAGYRIARLIGRGATGAVYLAADAEGNEVALKVLLPDLAQDARFRERFLRESQIAASLDEPHVVPTLAVGEDDGMLYLAMRVRRRARPARGSQARGPARARARRRSHRPGRRRARRGARARPRPPRREAGQRARADDGCGRARLPLRLRSRQARVLGQQPDRRAGARRHDRVHLARADRGRGDRRAGRRLLARAACSSSASRGEAPFERETEIATVYAHMNEPPPRATDVRPGIPARLRHRCRESAREGAGRPLRELRRARRGERVRPAWRAAAPQPGRGAASRGALAVAAVAAAAVVGGIVLSDDGGGGGAPAPRLAIAPKTMGLIDAVLAQGRRAPPVREPAVGRGVRRAPRVGAARRRAARRARGPRVAQGALVDDGSPSPPAASRPVAAAAWVTEDDGPGSSVSTGRPGGS